MREKIDHLDAQFRRLHHLLVAQANELPEHPYSDLAARSILRAAASIEQICNGISTRLWDDPFEWTLPEYLSSRTRIIRYLDEVESTRQLAFAYLTDDSDLDKQIPAPRKLRTLFELFSDTLREAYVRDANTTDA